MADKPFRVVKGKCGDRWVLVGALWKKNDKLSLSINTNVNLSAFAEIQQNEEGYFRPRGQVNFALFEPNDSGPKQNKQATPFISDDVAF